MKCIVVLGTGTGVGKTWITAALARALRARGDFVTALKPIESGVSAGAATDAGLLAEASSARPEEPPYRLPDPVSPHLAARRAGMSIELAAALRYVQLHMLDRQRQPDWVIVETAGALLSPLSVATTNWDLARALEPAYWVLVAPDALGVLHDLSVTLEVLRARGRPPDAIVLCAAREPDASTGTNAEELRRLGIAEPIACLPRGAGAADLQPLVEALAARS